MNRYLKPTEMLNYKDARVQEFVKSKNWQNFNEKDKILAIYNYVQDEIPFGYNTHDTIAATSILKDGYGQCNTKGTLFMTLLRAVGVPCRTHGFFIEKRIQKGVVNGIVFGLCPKELVHSWVEVYYQGQWLNIEGFILDRQYLNRLQDKFKGHNGSFCGYGAATPDLQNPQNEWNEGDTYIQKDAITKDLGVFDSPDELFAAHRQTIGRMKGFMYKNIIRHIMNRNTKRIRLSGNKNELDSIRRYNSIARQYDDSFDGRFTAKFKREMLELCAVSSGDAVLDVGCANGSLISEIKRKGNNIRACGVDIAPNMIDECRKRYKDILFKISSGENLPFENGSFDMITICCVLHHLNNPVNFFREAHRVLKTEGTLLVGELWFPFGLRQLADWVLSPLIKAGDNKLFSHTRLKRLFAGHGFSITEIYKKGTMQIIKGRKQ